jgi:hypothetical protein
MKQKKLIVLFLDKLFFLLDIEINLYNIFKYSVFLFFHDYNDNGKRKREKKQNIG